MSKRSKLTRSQSFIRSHLLSRLSRIFLVLTVVAAFGLLFSSISAAQRNRDSSPLVLAVPSSTKVALAITPTPTPPPVALVAGHSGGSDPGAMCPDGTREVDVTVDVAQRGKKNLEARGYRVEILSEFDARLSAGRRDYSPRAFLAIHADSCIYNLSGFKIVRATNSVIPLEDDRFVRCVKSAYQDATLLPFHADSITINMTLYHGLQEINPQTPGAILELGFLGSDGDLLKNKHDLLAQGVVEGIDAFLKGSQCQ